MKMMMVMVMIMMMMLRITAEFNCYVSTIQGNCLPRWIEKLCLHFIGLPGACTLTQGGIGFPELPPPFHPNDNIHNVMKLFSSCCCSSSAMDLNSRNVLCVGLMSYCGSRKTAKEDGATTTNTAAPWNKETGWWWDAELMRCWWLWHSKWWWKCNNLDGNCRRNCKTLDRHKISAS